MSNNLYENINMPQTGYSTKTVEKPKLSIEGNKVISSVLTSAPIDNDSESANISDGTWSQFRKLVSYYSECLRNEEGADASAFIDDIGKKYIYASGIGDWSPKTGKKWNYVLPIGDYNQDFVQTILAQNNIDNIVIFGYPLEAVRIKSKTGPDTRLIRPVFQYILNTNFTENTLNINTVDSQPEISLEWMKYSLKNYAQQFHFLSHCGLINQSRAIDEPMGYTSEDVRPNLDELVKRLSTFMPKEVREPLNIRSINANAIPTDFKNGIYNKAVIMIGNRTKFTQTLLKELTIIGSHSDEALNKTALKYLFTKTDDVEKILESKPHEETVADALLMNAEQRESVASILTNNLSVVTGPPGTGKSQVVMGAVANARLQNKSVLFTSRNHKAIDAVVDRLKDDNGEPLIIRTNSKDDPSLSYTFRNGINDLRADSIDVKTVKHYKRKHEQLTQRLIKRGERAIELENIWSLRDEIGEIEDKVSWLKEKLENPVLDKLMGSYQKIKKNELKSFNHIIDFINKYSNNNAQGKWISYAFSWLS
ncbi:MAG: AAA family ATPase, partial [Candidatus Brocadiales bacterium]|nr:AAA family ATPase [Candidatus Brocadiales bacterium]